MNKRPFKLACHLEFQKTVPDDGESVGEELAKAAEHREEHYRTVEPKPNGKRTTPLGELNDWSARRVSQLYYLAADAFEHGASASIGHNRTDRYMARAKELRGRADELLYKYCSK